MALSGSQSINIHGGAHTLIVEWSASQNTNGNLFSVPDMSIRAEPLLRFPLMTKATGLATLPE